MWKASIQDDQAKKTVVNLVRDEYTVGRAEPNTIRLTDRNVSRLHAKLVRDRGSWYVEDLGSYNGVYVNGARVAARRPLTHGDTVQLGDYRVEMLDEELAEVEEETEPNVVTSHTDQDRLIVVHGPDRGAEFPLGDDLTVVGRGEECDIVINHASVSRVHAEIQSLGDGRYEILDRESANGVRINGVELQRSLLDARDTVELGDVVLKYIPAGQIYRPRPEEELPTSAALPADSLSPAPAMAAASPGGLSTSLKLAIAGAAVVIIAIAIVTVSGEQGPETASSRTESGPATESSQILSDAVMLFNQGDIEAAHQKLTQEIPADSNVRQAPEFRKIEAAWADRILEQAADETDLPVKRALLEQVAQTPTIDSVRRKRAQKRVAELVAEGVELSELPSAPNTEARAPRPRAPQAPRKEKEIAKAAAPAPPPPAASPPPEPAPPPKPTAPSKPTGDDGDATLIRDNPFE